MKALHSLFAAALFAAPIAALAQAPEHITGSVGTVTVALTLSYTAPGTVAKDENGKVIKPIDGGGPAYYNEWQNSTATKEEEYSEYISKILTQKYGNKELLLDLVDYGILPHVGAAPYIAGWSIVQVTPTDDTDDGVMTGEPKFLAIHAGQSSVDLTEVLSGMPMPGSAEAATYKTAYKTNLSNPDNPITSFTVTDFGNGKEVIMIDIDFSEGVDEPTASFQGIFTSSYKRATVGAAKHPVIVVGAQKLAAVSGYGPFFEDMGDSSTVEGSVSIGAGKAVEDVSVYDPTDS